MRSYKKIFRSDKGFSLVELMFAMVVLTVGVLGGLVMILIGMARNGSNRVDTTATNAAQAVLEEIAGAPANATPSLPVTDCAGNSFSVNTAGGVSPGSGAPLLANGDIDFSQGPVPGYQMNYTVCGTNSNIQTVYDVRWNVTMIGPGNNTGKLVVVSARQPFVAKGKGFNFIAPVTLRTFVGM